MVTRKASTIGASDKSDVLEFTMDEDNFVENDGNNYQGIVQTRPSHSADQKEDGNLTPLWKFVARKQLEHNGGFTYVALHLRDEHEAYLVETSS